jgi:hypothetical protein
MEGATDESSDAEDEYGVKRKKSGAVKRHKKKKARMNQTDFEMPYTRINVRNGREAPNYNEEEMMASLSDTEGEFEYYEAGEARKSFPSSESGRSSTLPRSYRWTFCRRHRWHL